MPSKYLYRLVHHFLQKDQLVFNNFLDELTKLRDTITLCSNCYGWCEKGKECPWCGSGRDQYSICVVETWIDAISFERSGIFRGSYHMLGGALSPLDGITPDLLNFQGLLTRINRDDCQVNEIIIATNQTPEGDATSFYLERLLMEHRKSITITCLASGVPVGGNLEFIDRVTLGKAFSFRRTLRSGNKNTDK